VSEEQEVTRRCLLGTRRYRAFSHLQRP